jgi:rhodanese-related sulfurtransferase
MKRLKKIEFSVILIGLLLSTFVLVIQPVGAEEPCYHNITAAQAKNLIEDNPNVLVLDVRNQSEYQLGHLYNAVWMPLPELRRLNQTDVPLFGDFFTAYANRTTVVYCSLGSRSAEACQILTQHNFTDVYNMEGGITAWMEANYPIYCPSHYASIANQNSISIEPWLLYNTNCPCQNKTAPPIENPLDIINNANLTIIEQNENQTIVSVSLTVNGTNFEVLCTKTLLWKYIESDSGVNNTVKLSSVNAVDENFSVDLLVLDYTTQHPDYTMTVDTYLAPGGSQNYNGSTTKITYSPTGMLAVPTKEAFEFNNTATLAQQYHILAKLAKDLKDIYGDSEDNVLASQSDYYSNMRQSLNYLSGTIETNLPEYNLMIQGPIIGQLGASSVDPEAVSNGNFESGSNYWTLTGSGYHYVTSYLGYDGSNSLALGYNSYNYQGSGGRDQAYQLVYLPSNAINKHLSFVQQWRSLSNNMYFEVYVAPQGGNPTCVYSTGGYGYYDYSSVDIDLSSYSGNIYVFFDVLNYDGINQAGDWVDQVSVSYDEQQQGNLWDCMNCVGTILLFGIGYPVCDACLGFIASCTFGPEICIPLLAFFCGDCIVTLALIDWYCLSCAIALGLPV